MNMTNTSNDANNDVALKMSVRLKEIAELLRLQKHLSEEVARKTKENEQLFCSAVIYALEGFA